MTSLEQKFIKAVGHASDQRGKPALLGKSDGTLYWVDDSGMTHRTRVWARIGEQASNQVVVVDCLRASPQVDMPVRVDYKNGRLTVVDVDERRAIEFSDGRGGSTVPAHAWLHSRLGPDPVYIEGLQFLPLLVTPTNPPDLTVTVQGGAYTDSAGDLAIHDTAASGSTSAFVPATDYHFVIICLDRTDGSIVIVDGDDITAEDVLFSDVVVTAADIEAVTISDDYKPLGVVLLYPGQTQIKAKDIVEDLRNDSGGGGGTPGGSDTQLQYNNGGAFGGATAVTYDDVNDDLIVLGSSNDSLLTTDFSANTVNIGTNGSVGAIAKFGTTGIVFNDGGDNRDFRVEGGFSINLFVVDAAQNAVRIGQTTAGEIAEFRSTNVIVNPNNGDIDFVARGDSTTNLFVVDAGMDAVRIGSGIAGAIADFGPSGIVINNAEADIDFRIAGNGVTNGIYYDAGNNRTGFGTNAPQATLEARGDTETSFWAKTYHASQSSQFALFRARGTEALPTPPQIGDIIGAFSFRGWDGSSFTGSKGFIAVQAGENWSDTGTGTEIRFSATADGSTTLGTRMIIQNGIQVGFPTGGDKGTGWINVAGGISLNNSNYANPDYALHHYFHGDLGPFADNPGADKYGGLVPLDRLEGFLRKNSHLPNRWESQNIFEWADMAQMWCEELAIYVTQLHKRVKQLEAQNG